MPSWCKVEINFSGRNEILDIIEIATETGLLEAMIPTPPDIAKTKWPNKKNPKIMTQKYGFPDWYTWRIANWGTNQDICVVETIRDDDNMFSVFCNTAWDPPIPAVAKMYKDLNISILMYYFFPDTGLVGTWENGIDHPHYNIDTVEKAIALPNDLDQIFNISEDILFYANAEKEDQT